MLARHYIAKKEKEFRAKHPEYFKQPNDKDKVVSVRDQELAVQKRELAVLHKELEVWHREQVIKWEGRKRQAEAEGREFTEPKPEPPPGVDGNGYNS